MERGSWRTTVAATVLVLALSGAAWAAPPGGVGAGGPSGGAAPASGQGAGGPGNGANAGGSSSNGAEGGGLGQGAGGPGDGANAGGSSSNGAQGLAVGQGAGGPGNAGSSSNGPGTPANAGSGQAGLSVGRQVAAAVQAALAGGATGTALAEAVHQVILSEKPNAKGLTVAMAVYQRLTSGGGGAGPTTSGTSGSTESGGSGASTPAFADLSQALWANDAVEALKQAGVVNGTGPDQFSPDQPVTEAELVTMLARLQAGSGGSTGGAPSGTPSWAQEGMAWAQGSGLLSGVQGLGAPDGALTRAQAVALLLNAAGLGGVAATQASAPIGLSGEVPAWAHGVLALAIQLGILQGSGGQLLADQPLTRAQMAVLLARLAVLEAQAVAASG
jgi:hypothetical protein